MIPFVFAHYAHEKPKPKLVYPENCSKVAMSFANCIPPNVGKTHVPPPTKVFHTITPQCLVGYNPWMIECNHKCLWALLFTLLSWIVFLCLFASPPNTTKIWKHPRIHQPCCCHHKQAHFWSKTRWFGHANLYATTLTLFVWHLKNIQFP